MTLNKFTAGTPANADEVNENILESIYLSLNNLGRQQIDRKGVFSADTNDAWGEAYIGSNGQENSIVSTSTLANFDTNKYTPFDSDTPYILFEGTDETVNFNSNDCLLVKLSSGNWILYYTGAGNEEVGRAQLYKSLYSNGLVNTFTNLTAIKTKFTRDVGKNGFKASVDCGGCSSDNAHGWIYLDMVFSNTSDNDDCSSWSDVGVGIETDYTGSDVYGRWEIATGTTRNQIVADDDEDEGWIYEIGTDRSGDEISNPATARLSCDARQDSSGNDDAAGQGNVIILAKGDITFTENIYGDPCNQTSSYTKYASTVPDLTLGTISSVDSIITHTIPSGTFNSTISSFIASCIVEDWETGANIQIKLTNSTEDSGWFDYRELAQFTAFTSEPTTLITKLIPKTTSPTAGYPSIRTTTVRCS